MSCGLSDISPEHKDHYCHKCNNVSSLGTKDSERPCRSCLDIGNCNFEPTN